MFSLGLAGVPRLLSRQLISSSWLRMAVACLLVALSVAVASAQDPGPLANARARAADYLERTRDSNGGWGSQTHRGAAAMSFLRPGYFATPVCDAKRVGALVKANMFADLYSTGGKSTQTALYALALLATGQFSDDIEGYNIRADLENKTDFMSVYANALNMVAVCLAHGSVNATNLEVLIERATMPPTPDEWIDTRSMATMALACLTRSRADPRIHDALQISGHIHERLQREDGSFGNVYSSALAMQALLSLNGLVELNEWNHQNAINYILGQQGPSGAFDSIVGTFQVSPLLVSRTFLDVGRNLSSSFFNPLSTSESISIKYILRRESPSRVDLTINEVQGRVPSNISFFEIMKLYGDPDSPFFKQGFQFTYTIYGDMGAFITSIGGLANNNTHYWMLYQRHQDQTDFIMTDVGVSSLYPKDGDDVAFIYKGVNNDHS